MNQNPLNPAQQGPKPSRGPERIATAVGTYALAFVRISIWSVVAFATGALVYVAFRGIMWAVSVASDALGV